MPIYFKGCPRCHGDVIGLSDRYGAYLDCLQCGSMPPQLVINRPDTKGSGISIDAHIETLWVLNSRGKMSAFSPDGLVKDESLEKRLKAMAQYGYVAVESSNGNTGAPKNWNYCITQEGRGILGEYMGFVKTIIEQQKSEKVKIGSYELVDENGKLTLIGKYFVLVSQATAKFVDDIYPTANLSTEHPETAKEPQESRAVQN